MISAAASRHSGQPSFESSCAAADRRAGSGGWPRARRRRTGRDTRRRPRCRAAARRAGARARRAGSSERRRCGRPRTPPRGHVDEHDVAAAEPLEQAVAADRLDLVAEVVARRALDLGQPGCGGVAQRQPQPQRLVAGERVAHARCLRARESPSPRRAAPAGAGRYSRSTGRSRARAPPRRAAPGPSGRAARAGAGSQTPCPSPRSPRTDACL